MPKASAAPKSNLLREIQDGASDSSVSLADLLRKCKILAKRLHHEPLAAWADKELNGYLSSDELPPYRSSHAEVKGTFLGPFQAQMNNYPIPSLAIDEGDRDFLFTLRCTEGVAHYEGLIAGGDNTLSAPWPSDYVAIYQSKLIEGYVLVEAHRPVTKAFFQGMLDQVRTRILSFALEIEEADPQAGEAPLSGAPPVPISKVDSIYTTIIMGGASVVSSGSGHLTSTVNSVVMGDWNSLAEAIRALGIPEQDVEKLKKAIADDGNSKEPGKSVKSWLGDVATRIGSGSLSLANSAAGSILGMLIAAYFGLTPK